MNNRILTFNFNTYMPVNESLSYRAKIVRFGSYVQSTYPDADVIAIQEYSSAKKYLQELAEVFGGEYLVLAPSDFSLDEHPRSLLIDHIFFSKKAWEDFNPSGFVLDGDLMDEISDHCLLVTMSA